MIEYVYEKHLPNKIKLLYSSRNQSDIIFNQFFDQFHNNQSNINVDHFLTREPMESTWSGKRGRITFTYIQDILKDFNLSKIACFICGTPSFVVNMSVLLKDAGVDEERIFHEKW